MTRNNSPQIQSTGINIFSNLKVGTKVGMGSGLILLCLVAVAAVAYFGLSGANSNFTEYRGYALQTNQMGRIQANLLTARLNAKDFILKNTDESAQKVRERITATANLIDEATGLFDRKEAVDTITGAKEGISTYQSSFQAVTELVKKRNAVVDVLNTVGPQAEKNLTAIMKSAFADNDAAASFLAGTDLRSLLLARLYANRFLVDNAAASADRANKELNEFSKIAEKMLSELQNPTRRELAKKVLQEAEQYKASFNEVVEIINKRNGIIRGTLDVIGPNLADQMEQLKLSNKALQDDLGPRATKEVNSAVWTTGVVSIIALALGAALAWLVGQAISKPVIRMTETMLKLSGGDLTVDIPALGQSDEIGKMAKAVSTFKEAAIEKTGLERRSEEERQMTDQERAAREKEKETENQRIQRVVTTLADGLKRLAKGDLTANIVEPFGNGLDELRVNFNESIENMRNTLVRISSGTDSINSQSQEMRSAADNLSARTEQQAASLEETSAALEQITATVGETSSNANNCAEVARNAKTDTDKSSAVVGDAILAMEGIEAASTEISNIINVIDEIAFQTNLLALNAGVEAARAGDAGKGFAVVAQEVRELAQRAANAAKDIKNLITKSGDEVANGVKLVKETGSSLSHISQQVTDINEKISNIATAASEQLLGVQEVNTAVAQMDQVTQQNAAMVEESTAVAVQMSEEVRDLAGLISEFELDATADFDRDMDIERSAA